MDKSKNNKVYIYAYSISFIIIVILFSLIMYKKDSTYNNKINNKEINTTAQNYHNKSKLGSWDYEKIISNYEKTWIWNLSKEEKEKLLSTYLSYWNYFYKEEENSKKAIELLNTMDENYNTLYYKWYAKEIVKDYIWALDSYNKWLELKNLDDNKKAILLNQIWHVYDLMWKIDKAQDYYKKAEALWQDLPLNLLNRWRYEYRSGNFQVAEKYFNKLITLDINSFMKSEVYFDLSSIYLTKKDWTDKAIEYANHWVESNSSYPNNYISLWIGYIKKWWDEFDLAKDNLQKAIELYPNSSIAYKRLGVYFYIKDDFDNAIVNFSKQLDVSLNDITLMQDEKENSKNSAIFDLSKCYALKQDIDQSINYLNKLLDWWNENYYSYFLTEMSVRNWAYDKIKLDDKFVKNLQKIMNLYINK